MPISSSGTAYELDGPENAPVVVLIHGLGLIRQMTWERIVPKLSAHFRVLSYDLLGHGETRLPTEEVSLRSLSCQLLALMDELQIGTAALVGFSLGGMINRRFALDRPERVSALVVLNSPHDRGEELQKTVEEAARASAEAGPGAVIDAALARWFTKEFHGAQSRSVAAIKETILANDKANYAAHRWVLANGVRELIDPEPPISKPCLVVTCADDSGSTPDMSIAIAGEIEGAETRIVPALKHLGLIEKPEVFGDLLTRFLQETLRDIALKSV